MKKIYIILYGLLLVFTLNALINFINYQRMTTNELQKSLNIAFSNKNEKEALRLFNHPKIKNIEKRVLGELLIEAINDDYIKLAKKILKTPDININYNSMYSNQTALIQSLEKGYIDIVQELLAMPGIDVNNASYETTPLILASKLGLLHIVKELIKAGADVNCSINKTNALIESLRNNHIDIAQELLKVPGIDVNSYNPLIVATKLGNLAIVKELIQKNTGTNDLNYNKETALILASELGFINIVKQLIQAGTNINYTTGNTNALTESLRNGHVDITQELLATPEIDVNSHNPLIYAAKLNNLAIVKQLIEKGADINRPGYNKETALTKAIESGHINIAKELIQKGADINKPFAYLKALEYGYIDFAKELLFDSKITTESGEKALIIATSKGYTEIVKLLLEKKVNPNFQIYENRTTALIIAAKNGFTEIVKLLLQAKANPNTQEYAYSAADLDPFNENVGRHRLINIDYTALILATIRGHTEIVKLLLEFKADPNIIPRDGKTALFIASSNNNVKIVKLLLSAGANPNIKNLENVTPLLEATALGHIDTVRELLKFKSNLNTQNNHGITALMFAADKNNKDILKLLIEAKANLNVQNKYGDTALMLAAFLGFDDIVALLIDAGANLNIQNEHGSTALTLAADKFKKDNPHAKIVKLLLNAGANTDIKNNDNKTALKILSQCDDAKDIVKQIKTKK